MSIIQEALKKAQRDIGGAPDRGPAGAAEGRDERRPAFQERPDRDPKAVLALTAVLVVVAIFAAARYLPSKAPPRDAGRATPPAVPAAAALPAVAPLEAPAQAASKPVTKEDFPALQSIVFNKQPEEKPRPGPEFTVNGIMYLEGSPRAIINGSMVGVGDTVNGARVARIEKRYVVLQYNGSEVNLELK